MARGRADHHQQSTTSLGDATTDLMAEPKWENRKGKILRSAYLYNIWLSFILICQISKISHAKNPTKGKSSRQGAYLQN